MPIKRPRVARLDEVTISRNGEQGIIAFRDGSVGDTHLTLGSKVALMTDEEILEAFNQMVMTMEQARATHRHVAVEVPVGSPQIEYHALSDQWVPRGSVLRCEIGDSGPSCETSITIDDQVLSLEEFGRLIGTYNGWGMRIIFVPDEETERTPTIDVREPEDSALP